MLTPPEAWRPPKPVGCGYTAGLLKVRTPDREGIQSGPTWYFKCTRITQTSGWRAWNTHTHTHRCMNQCCSDYRLFFKTKHTATSDILDKPLISFSRIMSPVSLREREVSPPRRSLSPPAELAAYSKNRTEPQQTREWTSTKQRFLKPLTVDCLTYDHEYSSSVKGWNMHIVQTYVLHEKYIFKNIYN